MGRKLSVIVIWFSLCACLTNTIHAYNIVNDGMKNSYLVFPKWTSDQNVKLLTFRFKTNRKNGLLLIANDAPKNENELKLSLISGSLYFSFKMGSEDMLSVKEASLGKEWNDMSWHDVILEQRFREVYVKIDQYEYSLFTEGANDWLSLTSNIYIGGSPVNSFEGFTGCFETLDYDSQSNDLSPLQVIGNVLDECIDRCTIEQESLCKNNGKCLKYFVEKDFKCDCTGTGYKDDWCEEEEISGFFTGSTYLTRSMDALQNFRLNKITLRLRSIVAEGVVLFTSLSRTNLLIEMAEGRIIFHATFGTDIVQMTSRYKYHDGKWHSIVIKRSGSNVTMVIDHEREVLTYKLKYPPMELCVDQKQKVFVGGHHYPQSISQSRSQSNFIGCLQQVYFQEENTELISQHASNDIYTKVVGNELEFWKCSVPVRDIKQDSLESLMATSKITESMSRKKLDHRTVAWLTTGICVGIILLLATLGIALHYTRKRYSGRFTAKFQNNGKKYGASRAPSIELSMEITEKRRPTGKRFMSMASV